MLSLQDRSQIFSDLRLAFIIDFNTKEGFDKTRSVLSLFLEDQVFQNTSSITTTSAFGRFELEKKFERGGNSYRLSTPMLPFLGSKSLLNKILGWIIENGETNENSDLYCIIGAQKGSFLDLRKMNFLKLIMLFNEDKVLKDFPRQNHVFSRPIKKLLSLDFDPLVNVSPIKKSFAVEFGGPFSNYLVLKYFGGKDYQTKKSKIFEGVDEFIDALVTSIREPNLSIDEKERLKKIQDRHIHLVQSLRNLAVFKESFPKINFTIDLNTHDSRVHSFFATIRTRLLEIIRDSSMTEGYINYDSDQSKFQIKEGNLKNSFFLQGIDILESEVGGMVVDCDIFESNLNNCYISKSNLFSESTAKSSYLLDSYVNGTSKLIDCHFTGRNGIMIGEMERGLFENGKINNISRISNTTRVLEYEKIK